jgi:hypothetical protein
VVRDTYLRSITEKERNNLHLLVDEDDLESGYRAKLYRIYERLQTIMITTSENGFIDSMKKE